MVGIRLTIYLLSCLGETIMRLHFVLFLCIEMSLVIESHSNFAHMLQGYFGSVAWGNWRTISLVPVKATPGVVLNSRLFKSRSFDRYHRN